LAGKSVKKTAAFLGLFGHRIARARPSGGAARTGRAGFAE
jgi:hypothetical protein